MPNSDEFIGNHDPFVGKRQTGCLPYTNAREQTNRKPRLPYTPHLGENKKVIYAPNLLLEIERLSALFE